MSVRQGLGKDRVRRPTWYVWALTSVLLAGIALSATPASAEVQIPLWGTTPVPADDPSTPLVDEGRKAATSIANLEVVAGDSQTVSVGGTFAPLEIRACGGPLPDPNFFLTSPTSCGAFFAPDVDAATGVEIEALSVTFEMQDLTGSTSVPSATATFASGPGVSPDGKTFTGTTGSNGRVTTPGLIANNVKGPVIVNVKATLPNGTSKERPVTLNIAAGVAVGLKFAPGVLNPQRAVVGNQFASDLGVVAVDQFGNPAGAGTSVSFTVNPVSGATASLTPAGPVTTNNNGLAKVTATASGGIGSYTVRAEATLGGPTNPTYPKILTFNLSNTAPPKNIAVDASSSATLSTIINTRFAPLVVKVTDDFGNPVIGQVVTFTVNPVGGASAAFDLGTQPGANPQQITVTTSTGGLATAPDLTANATTGTYTVTATFSAASVDANGAPVTYTGTTTFNLTNGDASTLAFARESAQTQATPVNTDFRETLKVRVTLGGSPVANTLIRFAAPTTGASGYFINDGAGQTGQQDVHTDDQGIAETSVFRANGTAGGPYTVTANLAGATTGGTTFQLTNSTGDPAGTSSVDTDADAATLEVRVTDEAGSLLPGVRVTFRVVRTGPGGGATLTNAAGTQSSDSELGVTTDASGVALVRVTPGADPGTYEVHAFVDGAPTVVFTLENTGGGVGVTPPPGSGASGAHLQAVSDLTPSARVGTAFQPFTVRVVDDQGRGVNGVPVTFTVTTGTNGATGTFASATPVTTAANNPDGSATSSVLTANPSIGEYTVVATAVINGTPETVTFTLNNTAGDPVSLTLVSGSPQVTPRSAPFPNPLVVRATDAAGLPVANATVVFTAPEPQLGPNSAVLNPSGTFASADPQKPNVQTVKTDANGVATSSVFTANATYGSYKVVASIPGTNLRVEFQLSNDYTDEFVRNRTTRLIKNFMGRRGEQITSAEPDLTRRLNRGSAGAGADNGGVQFAGSGDDENSTVTVATSMYQIFAAQKQRNAKQTNALAPAMGLGAYGSLDEEEPTGGFDLWVEGKWSRIDQETATNDSALFYVGLDYRVSPNLLLGILGQIDYTTDIDKVGALSALDEVEVSGTGWMVGPYMVARLSDNLIFDARGAWGQSDNEINPLGLYTDSFDGERWLTKAQLTGDFRYGAYGALQFAPHVGVMYFEETQKAYTDTLGVDIPEQTVSLGRMTFGPKFAMHTATTNGTIVAPYVAVKGIWDFTTSDETADVVSGAEIPASSEGLRGRTEGGIAITLPNGASIAGEGFLDGLGTEEFTAYGGSARVNVPLH